MGMRMYNRFLFLFLWFFGIILYPGWLSAQEYEPVLLRVLSETNAWGDNESFPKSTNYSQILGTGLSIYGLSAARLGTIDNDLVYFSYIRLFDETEYRIPSYYVSPWLTNVDFPDNWILNLNDENRKRWVITYYLDVFSSQKRDTLLRYENDWIELCTEAYNQGADYGPGADWTEVAIVNESLFFFPASISLGTLTPISFWILQRKKIDNGYSIAVQGDSLF